MNKDINKITEAIYYLGLVLELLEDDRKMADICVDLQMLKDELECRE